MANYGITWNWGKAEAINFNPLNDVLNFGWLQASQFSIENDANGKLKITILDNGGHNYTLSNISVDQLTSANFIAHDAGTMQKIRQFLDESDPVVEEEDDHEHPNENEHENSDDDIDVGEGVVNVIPHFNTGADIANFDPAHNTLNFGDVSVHGIVITKTTDGDVAITNPWNQNVTVLEGVSYSEMSINNFGIVQNEHFRQDIGGVVSWEKGIGPRDANTTYIRSHEYNKTTIIEDFDVATDKISFLYYGTRERLSVEDTAEGLKISTQPTNQIFIFKGLTLSELKGTNLDFHHDQVVEDNLEVPFGFTAEQVNLVSRSGLLTPQAPTGATTDGWQVRAGKDVHPNVDDIPDDDDDHDHDDHDDHGDGNMVDITWNWGKHETVSFDPDMDMIHLGWLQANQFTIGENNQGDVVIGIVNNGGHDYTFTDVSLEDLTMDNFDAKDAGARHLLNQLLDDHNMVM